MTSYKSSKQRDTLNIGQTLEGPKEVHEDDQRAREPVLWAKTEEMRSFHPGQEKA